MARSLRIEDNGAACHIASRGNEKKPVCKDDADRLAFLKRPDAHDLGERT
jgi:hypothetical protein